jgi:hypothetical protein
MLFLHSYLKRYYQVELTHIGLNPKFDMSFVFMANYFFNER